MFRKTASFRGMRTPASMLRQASTSSKPKIKRDLSASFRDPREITNALRVVMPVLADRGGFNYTEAWVPEYAGDDLQLKCKETYADDSFTAVRAFREAALSITLGKGRGAPGRVFESGSPEFFEDLKFKGRARMNSAEGAGLISGLCIPVNDNEGYTQAVIHFYCTKKRMEDPEFVKDLCEQAPRLLAAQMVAPLVKPRLGPSWDNINGEKNKEWFQEQMDQVFDRMYEIGSLQPAVIYEDVDWFYNGLRLAPNYFRRFGAQEIARHISAYSSAKKLSALTQPGTHDEEREKIDCFVRTPSGFVIMRDARNESIDAVEDRLDAEHQRTQEAGLSLSTVSFLSKNSAVPYGEVPLSVYVADVEEYGHENVHRRERDINKIAPPKFLGRVSDSVVVERYQSFIDAKMDRISPLVTVGEKIASDNTIPIVIGLNVVSDRDAKSSRGFFRILSELCDANNVTVRRKFSNTLANGLRFFSLYVEDTSQEAITQIVDSIRLLALLPKSNLDELLINHELSTNEYAYGQCAANFVYYFIKNPSEDMALLRASLAENGDEANAARLERVARSLQSEALTPARVEETLKRHPGMVKLLFNDFDARLNPKSSTVGKIDEEKREQIKRKMNKEVMDDFDRLILETAVIFNSAIVKTNFYKERKAALAFRYEPETFLEDHDLYPVCPYGVFQFMSSNFRGFHVRFRDVARGGLRLIPSRDKAAYALNRESLFRENYGLALTQNNKNKDIPEFGSKGTILLEPHCQESGELAFTRYISGMLDLLLPDDDIADLHGKEEIIFCGPDEGTADVMEWAAYYAKHRGYAYWKAFTTGKPPSMGGIPHDTYGMTTRSVHEYVVGLLEKEGLDEAKVTKLQTGGPDGDLGSNEITISSDKTTSIVDGSGVLHDPNGLDRGELNRLAEERVMVENFDLSKLSGDGFLVKVTDTDVKVPGLDEPIESGLAFRNNFHLNKLAAADLFVPCGGRPESINATNVKSILQDGNPNFKYIVEGANLFITEDARDTLEKAGVVLFKDASTNKGGVTSSSCEVLAALAMTDEEHAEHMQVVDGKSVPEFYQRYVEEVQTIIENNARLEFECIWQESMNSNVPKYVITDLVSKKINKLNIAVQTSSLWDDDDVRLKVLKSAIPQELQNLVPIDELMRRLPEDYLRAVFGYYIASRYVYKYGLSAEEFAFYDFVSKL